MEGQNLNFPTPSLKIPSSEFPKIWCDWSHPCPPQVAKILRKSDEGVLRYAPKYMLCEWPNNARYTNFGRTFLKFRSSDSAQIFKIPRGGGPPSRGEKIPKADEGVLRKSGPKYTPVENFNPPYLPQMGGDPPRTKFVFARVHRPTMCYGQLRGGNPLGG